MKNKKNVHGGPVVKKLPCNAGHTGSVPGLARFHKPWGNEALAPLLKPVWSKVCSAREASTQQ